MTEVLTREQLHQELQAALDERLGPIEKQGRWRLRNIFTPDIVGRILVTAAVGLVVGAGLWFNLRRDVDENTAAIERHKMVQVESAARLDKRIDDEKEERVAADARVEARSTQALGEINGKLDELNRDIKVILRALPRPPGQQQ